MTATVVRWDTSKLIVPCVAMATVGSTVAPASVVKDGSRFVVLCLVVGATSSLTTHKRAGVFWKQHLRLTKIRLRQYMNMCDLLRRILNQLRKSC